MRSRYLRQKASVPKLSLIVLSKVFAEVRLFTRTVSFISVHISTLNIHRRGTLGALTLRAKCEHSPCFFDTSEWLVDVVRNGGKHTRTLSTTQPLPVEPKVSMAKYSPSSIFVWSLFLVDIMDLPPWISYRLIECPPMFDMGLTLTEISTRDFMNRNGATWIYGAIYFHLV